MNSWELDQISEMFPRALVALQWSARNEKQTAQRFNKKSLSLKITRETLNEPQNQISNKIFKTSLNFVGKCSEHRITVECA